ncbi:MAG TPA: hypothetical protein VLK29_07830 [Luteimonas sp.]|nr:hypothetical protein [Luteimonas sp.]
MSRTARGLVLALLVLLLAAVGAWRIAMPHVSENRPGASPSGATIGLQTARTALAAGDHAAAIAHARAVLAEEPLRGAAFAVLAEAMAGQGSDAEVLARYRIAVRRAPRDVHVRTWLATRFLKAGDYGQALVHLDALLTLSAASHDVLLPMLAQLAQDPGFAKALAIHLGEHPRWRTRILRAVARDTGARGDHLFAALRRHGGLTADEEARWMDGMLKSGRWGSAYARWASGLAAAGTVPLLHNGGFEQRPSSSGFDWHVRRVKGVVFRHGGTEAAGGARLTFLGRAVADTGLGHPLLLAPGRYRLSVRAKAPDLRSDQGLDWRVVCADGRTEAGRGARIERASGWVVVQMDFAIPAAGCEGQWLRLVNPAPAGMAQVVRGELHLQQVAIARLGAEGA